MAEPETQVVEAGEGDTVPLSPKEPLRDTPQFSQFSPQAAAMLAEEDLNEVDPFTFKPSFTLWDKILVRQKMPLVLKWIHSFGVAFTI